MSSYRFNSEQLHRETNSEVRNLLRYELNSALTVFIREDRPVYLEGLGIIVPSLKSDPCSRVEGHKITTWCETIRTIYFEKCYELITLHHEKYPHIAELRELIAYIYPRLPLFITTKHDERTIRRYLRGIIDGVRREVVETGHSGAFSSIGDLFALHNRQGDSIGEWYAGADIFLKPNFFEVLGTSEPRSFERPVLESAWELLNAAFGDPVACYKLNVPSGLHDLGYDSSLLPASNCAEVRIAAFLQHDDAGSNSRYIFCTEGFRSIAFNGLQRNGDSALSPSLKDPVGSEAVFQLKAPKSAVDSPPPFEQCTRAMTAAWILIQSARSKSLKPGAGLTIDKPLFQPLSQTVRSSAGRLKEPMLAIFTTPFSFVRSAQRCSDGLFKFINIVALTRDEAELASRYSPEYLLSLLEMRDLLQVSNPARPSFLTRTELSHSFGKSQLVRCEEPVDEQELLDLEAHAFDAEVQNA